MNRVVLCYEDGDPLIVFRTIEEAKDRVIKAYKGEDNITIDTIEGTKAEQFFIVVKRDNVIVKKYKVAPYKEWSTGEGMSPLNLKTKEK